MSATLTGLGDIFSLLRNAKGWDFNRKLKMEDIRLPHIYDVIDLLTEDNEALLTANPGSMCVFMGGFEAEAEEFKRLRPKFFFINCDLLIGATQQGGENRTQLVVPVIFRGGHYYIIPGIENIPLYRVHRPEQFFFSTEGRCVLIRLLTRCYCHNRGDALSFLFTREGKLLMYCVPKVTDKCGFPNEMWDDLTEDQIELNIPFNLEHEPSVPNNRNYFVQLVRLNDPKNVIDINEA